MLEEFAQEQPIAYKILKNTIDKDKYSHAYLFETNGYYNSIPLVFSFVKAILCPNHGHHQDPCPICQMIDSQNYPELQVIKPDGLWIKKEQLVNLKEEFNQKALMGSKKVYVILEAEKLNQSSANSILKFLEEPEENIIAILVTNNIYQMLNTIISRCQKISLKEGAKPLNVEDTETKLNLILFNKKDIDEVLSEKIKKVINFPKYYENHHLETIVYMNVVWHDYIKNKDELLMAFDILIMYYKDVLNSLLNIKLDYFNTYENDIKTVAQKNNLESICHKLKILLEYKEKIKFNMNTNLLMDELIISFERR